MDEVVKRVSATESSGSSSGQHQAGVTIRLRVTGGTNYWCWTQTRQLTMLQTRGGAANQIDDHERKY